VDALIRESWLNYEKHKDDDIVVTPSVPILFFGDSKGYFESELKVITVGLNPSRVEFPESDRYLRFGSAQEIYPQIIDGHCYQEYLDALNGYFTNHPYKAWFNSFEPILNGLEASYYKGSPNTALHTDLCSPLATDPTWSKLSHAQREMLRAEGTALWHKLVETLTPDVIITSVAESHLNNINFTRVGEWRTIYTVARKNPYNVKLMQINIGAERKATLVFGRAAQKPFATVSSADKRLIGESLKGYIYGE
jgi:hypothetical protein